MSAVQYFWKVPQVGWALECDHLHKSFLRLCGRHHHSHCKRPRENGTVSKTWEPRAPQDVKAGNWHQYEIPYLLIPEHRSILFCKMGYCGVVRNKQSPSRRDCVTDSGSTGGLPKLLALGAKKRILNVIIPLCVNRRLQGWVPRSHYSTPLSAGSPLLSPRKQCVLEGM